MSNTRIEVSESNVRILDLQIDRPDVAQFLLARPEAERASALARSIEIGVFCLERATAGQDLEFVRRQVETLLAQVKAEISALPETTQKALAEKIGTGDGQVLAPVRQMVDAAKKAAEDKIREVASLLSEQLDPSKDSTTLGKVLRDLKDLLDPKRTDSIQGALAAAVTSVTSTDGALSETVKKAVGEALTPLSERVETIAKEIHGQEAAQEIVDQTTAKGIPYEEEITERLQQWAAMVGAEVLAVGADNKKGDVVVRVPALGATSTPTSIVIEVRNQDSPKGRKAISDHLEEAMAEREANAGIYLSRTAAGLAKEIGDFAEGQCSRGPFVACTEEHLITAIRLVGALRSIAAAQASRPETDAAAVQTHVERIRTAVRKVITINRHVTDVRAGADGISREADALREEINQSLLAIEAAIRLTVQQAAPVFG